MSFLYKKRSTQQTPSPRRRTRGRTVEDDERDRAFQKNYGHVWDTLQIGQELSAYEKETFHATYVRVEAIEREGNRVVGVTLGPMDVVPYDEMSVEESMTYRNRLPSFHANPFTHYLVPN